MMPRRGREGGFTLIEILVAFAILAIGFLVLLDPMAGGISRNARDRDYEDAVTMAQSKLASLGNDTPWFVGTRRGGIADRFIWRVDIGPSDDGRDGVPIDQAWRLHDIAVEISWPSAFGRRSFALTTKRLIPKALFEP